MANGSQNLPEKRGKFSGISAKAFRKRSVVLTRVEIRLLEVIKGQTFKIGVPTIRITVRDNASVGGVRWTTAWYDGLLVVRLTPTANFENIMEVMLTHPALRSITQAVSMYVVLLLLLDTAQYK